MWNLKLWKKLAGFISKLHVLPLRWFFCLATCELQNLRNSKMHTVVFFFPFKCMWMNTLTRRPASFGIFFARLKIFSSFFANGWKQNYSFDFLFSKFLPTSIWTLISVLYAKWYHEIPLKIFCLTVLKISVGEPFCAMFQKISRSKKVDE